MSHPIVKLKVNFYGNMYITGPKANIANKINPHPTKNKATAKIFYYKEGNSGA